MMSSFAHHISASSRRGLFPCEAVAPPLVGGASRRKLHGLRNIPRAIGVTHQAWRYIAVYAAAGRRRRPIMTVPAVITSSVMTTNPHAVTVGIIVGSTHSTSAHDAP